MDTVAWAIERLMEAAKIAPAGAVTYLPEGVTMPPEETRNKYGTTRTECCRKTVAMRCSDCPYVAKEREIAEAIRVRAALPTDHAARKKTPMCRGLLDYFPLACAEVARLSEFCNEQHNPGEPMHWAREKSTDHADCIVRHLVDRGKLDKDGQRHTAKVAWRALALLQTELELEGK